jgi:ergothioneine biosynthesis protein EgtB
MGDKRQRGSDLAFRYQAVRLATRSLAAGMSAEDQMVQSCPEASPMKWHQAHATWFFETFVLGAFLPRYKPFRDDFRWLFNSDCNPRGEKIADRRLRASFSRPSLDEDLSYRAHIDQSMETLLEGRIDNEACRLIVSGLHHEQQHQELMLTDIKHAFFVNPLHPAFDAAPLTPETHVPGSDLVWHDCGGGLVEIGYSPDSADPFDFCFDNENPRHRVHLADFRIASRDVTCREYLDFMTDGGYARAEFWLSDAWETVRRQRWDAPLYWERDATDDTGWRVFTLRGWHSLLALLDTPVCHVSHFEADAFARWRGCRFATEAEWEVAASQKDIAGNLLDAARLHPAMANSQGIEQLFGDCWQWTASAYMAYPGYKPLPPLSGYSGSLCRAK